MNVSLTPRLEAMIREKVESGLYSSASEVVREALRRMEIYDTKLERLRAEVQKGIDSAEHGRGVQYTRETMARLIQEADEDTRLGKPIRDAVKP